MNETTALTQNHPITPPPELVEEWATMLEYHPDEKVFSEVAQWGADQELDACCEWVSQWRCMVGGNRPEVGLRAARRPKPPSLNSIALQMLGTIERDAHYLPEITDTIRKALEALTND
jgi:hypothetical protein